MARRVLVVIAGILLTMMALPTPSASAKDKPGCPEGELIVDVTLTIKNVDDTANDGHVWALDSVVAHMRIWRVSTNRYCVRNDDAGTFTSFAGGSPGGTGTISSGVTGTIEGTQYFRAGGTFAPTVPTSGYIGEFNPDCQPDGSCANHDYRFPNLYFSKLTSFAFGWFSYAYDGGSHGTWLQSTNGSSGDITG
jgi:hypothetical protein